MNFLRKTHNCILKKAERENYPYFGYGLLQIILNPIYAFIWAFVDTQYYQNFFVRILMTVLCVPLVLHKYWPKNILNFLPYYWYLVCCYSLPFFFTFMLLKNDLSYSWALNSLTGVVLCILFLDMLSLCIIIPIGIFGGWLAYALTTLEPFYDANLIKTIFITFGSAFLFGGLFAQRARNITRERLHIMKMVAGSIAHELRTPLSAMMMGSQTLAKILPTYQNAYASAKEANLPIKKLSPDEEKYLIEIPESLQRVSQNAHTMITMLLTNLSEGTKDRKAEICSMGDCVKEALNTYPLSARERERIHWLDNTKDFSFLGHKELTKHVLFNLLKNALYAIAAAGKGEIFITIEPGEKVNKVIFKDTGSGMAAKTLRHIFNRFYTHTEHGTGIGLAFCQTVIQGFGGDITCASQSCKHTTFTMSIPVLTNHPKEASF